MCIPSTDIVSILYMCTPTRVSVFIDFTANLWPPTYKYTRGGGHIWPIALFAPYVHVRRVHTHVHGGSNPVGGTDASTCASLKAQKIPGNYEFSCRFGCRQDSPHTVHLHRTYGTYIFLWPVAAPAQGSNLNSSRQNSWLESSRLSMYHSIAPQSSCNCTAPLSTPKVDLGTVNRALHMSRNLCHRCPTYRVNTQWASISQQSLLATHSFITWRRLNGLRDYSYGTLLMTVAGRRRHRGTSFF